MNSAPIVYDGGGDIDLLWKKHSILGETEDFAGTIYLTFFKLRLRPCHILIIRLYGRFVDRIIARICRTPKMQDLCGARFPHLANITIRDIGATTGSIQGSPSAGDKGFVPGW